MQKRKEMHLLNKMTCFSGGIQNTIHRVKGHFVKTQKENSKGHLAHFGYTLSNIFNQTMAVLAICQMET